MKNYDTTSLPTFNEVSDLVNTLNDKKKILKELSETAPQLIGAEQAKQELNNKKDKLAELLHLVAILSNKEDKPFSNTTLTTVSGYANIGLFSDMTGICTVILYLHDKNLTAEHSLIGQIDYETDSNTISIDIKQAWRNVPTKVLQSINADIDTLIPVLETQIKESINNLKKDIADTDIKIDEANHNLEQLQQEFNERNR